MKCAVLSTCGLTDRTARPLSSTHQSSLKDQVGLRGFFLGSSRWNTGRFGIDGKIDNFVFTDDIDQFDDDFIGGFGVGAESGGKVDTRLILTLLADSRGNLIKSKLLAIQE